MTMVLHSPRTPWCAKDLLQADKAFCEGPALIPIVEQSRNTERGGESVCSLYFFFNFYNQQLIQYYASSHYHYMIISIVIIIISSSSHRKHSNIVHKILTWKPKSWGENHISLLVNSFPETTGRRKQPPYYEDFKFPATTGRRLQPPDLQDTT